MSGPCHPQWCGRFSSKPRNWHVSNLYYIQPRRVARTCATLCRLRFSATAVIYREAATKLLALWRSTRGKYELEHAQFFSRAHVGNSNCHRSEKVQAGYDPLPAGFRQIPRNDLAAAEMPSTRKTVQFWSMIWRGRHQCPRCRLSARLARALRRRGLLLLRVAPAWAAPESFLATSISVPSPIS